MKNNAAKNTAILGMAIDLADSPDLSSFWRKCAVGSEAAFHSPDLHKRCRPGELLEKTVCLAASDAGILADRKIFSDTWLLVNANESIREKIKIDSKLNFAKTNFFNADDLAGSMILEPAIDALRSGSTRFVVIAALGLRPVCECVALVLGTHLPGSSAEMPWALVNSLEQVEKSELSCRLADMPAKGIGELVYLARKDRITAGTGKNNKTGLDCNSRLTAMVPVVIIPASGQSDGAVEALAALVCTTMSLAGKMIPPSRETVLPASLMTDLPLYSNSEIRPWIQDTRLCSRQAVFLSKGQNDHTAMVILEEVSPRCCSGKSMPRSVDFSLPRESNLIVISADSRTGLSGLIGKFLKLIRQNGNCLEKIAAFMASRFVPAMPLRLAMVCTSVEELIHNLEISREQLKTASPDFGKNSDIYFTDIAGIRPGSLACLFPGLGFPGLLGPYADHLMELCLFFPECREVFDSVEIRDGHPEDPVPTSQIFFPPAALPEKMRSDLRKRLASPRIEDAEQPDHPNLRNLSSFGVSVANRACWQLLQKLNIVPDFLFGQSLGELSALCAAGIIDFNDFIEIYWKVGLAPERYSNNGRLALAGTGSERLAPYLERFSDVDIAIHVAPEFQILGGHADRVRELVEELRKNGIWTQFLPYPAIHTPRLTSLRPLMEPYLQDLPIQTGSIPVFSGMNGDIYPEDVDTIRKIMIANIDHPVFLWQTIRKIYDQGARLLIQVGGGATMYSQAKTNIGRDDLISLSLDVDYRSALTQVNHLCAELLVNGIDVRAQHLYEACDRDFSDMERQLAADDCLAGGNSEEAGTDMPFIGPILKYDEKSEIVMERVLDLSRDRFIRDHIFINARSVKPDSACLPVVPMTVSLEMMAEVAACLAPACGLLGFEDIRASSWIALLDSRTLSVQISARLYHVDRDTGVHHIAAAVFTPDSRKPAIQGTVLLGRQYVEQLALDFSSIDDPFRYPFREGEVYGERHLFHGPAFQCIKGETALTEKAVIGSLCVLSKQDMFTDIKAPAFLCDPVLLDGVGQLVGLWAIDRGEYVFPVGINKLEIYGPTPAEGSVVSVLVEIKEHSTKLLTADIEIQDGKGGVWMRIRGWKDWVFRWSRCLYDFRRQPERYLASYTLSRQSMPADAKIQYISRTDLRDMDMDALARFFLHVDEIRNFKKIRIPMHRWQYLLGRIAAKDALRSWLAGSSGKMLHPAGVMLEEDPAGRLMVKKVDDSGPFPQLGIYCSEQGAVAIAALEPTGVDLTRILTSVENSRASA